MTEGLVKRADAIRARNKLMETIPGSGMHDKDAGSPQNSGLSRGGEHVVPFFDYDDGECVHFAGQDAMKVMDALGAWLAKPKGDISSLPGTDRKLVLRIIPRLGKDSLDNPYWMCVPLNVWNDVLYALHAEGVGLTGAPFVDDGTTPK